MHLVHGPILRTPDTDKTADADLYEDNIAYMDKQVGAIVAELEKLGLREKTLIMFLRRQRHGAQLPEHHRRPDDQRQESLACSKAARACPHRELARRHARGEGEQGHRELRRSCSRPSPNSAARSCPRA